MYIVVFLYYRTMNNNKSVDLENQHMNETLKKHVLVWSEMAGLLNILYTGKYLPHFIFAHFALVVSERI